MVFFIRWKLFKKEGDGEGVLMGRILNLIEEEWIKNDFKISEDQISSIIQKQKTKYILPLLSQNFFLQLEFRH